MGGSASKSSPPADCAVLDQSNASSCPVPKSQRSTAVYNVYNQRVDSENSASTSRPTGDVDPRNNMPREPNQQPCAGQRQLISTSRLVSNIPKGGTQGTWVYPSPQMFYNGEQLAGLKQTPASGVSMKTASLGCFVAYCWVGLIAHHPCCSSEEERQRQ